MISPWPACTPTGLALLHEGHLVAMGDAAHVLRAETLSEFYGASVTVHQESDGTVVVVPRRAGTVTHCQAG